MTYAWHFVRDTLRNGDPLPPDGTWLEYDGPLPVALCERGLHASTHPFDALQYAPGPILCRVEVAGEIVRGPDKLVATRRRIVARRDATGMLLAFARRCASDVLPLWDAPDVVREYLRSGDDAIRAAARAAASAYASADASADAWNAARAAASAYAWADAWNAASSAAWYAERSSATAKYRDWFAEMSEALFAGALT